MNRVLDIFLRAQTSVHLLRAVEPTLRFGVGLEKFLERIPGEPLPKCQYQNTSLDFRCVNLASRRQLSEAVVALDEIKNEK